MIIKKSSTLAVTAITYWWHQIIRQMSKRNRHKLLISMKMKELFGISSIECVMRMASSPEMFDKVLSPALVACNL
jgi:hypothetical protein